MCRSIKLLRQSDGGPTDQELYEAALQYVRKISGYRKPARANQQAFDAAVAEIAAASRALLDRLPARKRPAHDHADDTAHRHDGATALRTREQAPAPGSVVPLT